MVAGAGAGVTSKLSGTVTGAGAGAAPGAGAFTARAIGAGDVGAGAVGAEAAGIVVDSVVVETAGEVPGEASFANDAFREPFRRGSCLDALGWLGLPPLAVW